MKQLTAEILINGIKFNFINEIEIVSSYNQLTDTAKLIIPRKINFRDKNGNPIETFSRGASAVFKRGNPVEIKLGYDHKNTTRFKGKISGMIPKQPFEFSFEDEMFSLKEKTINATYVNPSLKQLVADIIPKSIKYEITRDQNLGDLRVTNSTPAQILDKLRSEYFIYSFFRNGILYIGNSVVPKLQKTIRFEIFKNIIDDGENLQYINDFDRKIKVVAKSILDDNTELKHETGDSDGETRTLYFTNIKSEKDLEIKAKSCVNKLKYSGFEGSFETFLTPIVQHGDLVEIINPQFPEQSGGYLVDEVTINAGTGTGGRQKISIKQKVYDLNKQGDQYIIQNKNNEIIGA